MNPALAQPLEPVFHTCSLAEVDEAARLAAQAAPVLASYSGAKKAQLLRKIAQNIEGATAALAARAQLETALPEARCQGEIGRTMGQLKLFADLLEKGEWVDARIETAQPDRKPVPKPDHRSMCRPLGPVAVFCASNFPFAYSVAGGDTASALAAGCPVIVVAHTAHPGTAELMASLVVAAVQELGFPIGTFSMVVGDGRIVGQHLAKHPALRAIGFTGSRAGGKALMDTAAARPVPIPVYAEMSSVNPVVLLEGALASRGDAMVTGLFGSCTLGVGQFCTQPGIILLVRSQTSEAFVEKLSAQFRAATEGVMLTAGIQQNYQRELKARSQKASVTVCQSSQVPGEGRVLPALLTVTANTFLTQHHLQAELFGPASLVVWCDDLAQVKQVISTLEGSLTATLHGTTEEIAQQSELLAQLETLAGRVILNGYPTGVEVSHAIVHGGPYPSLSDGRTTSVGSNAIYRFTRLVCYQSYLDAALPVELQNANPLKIARLVNGQRTTEPVS
jgi:NADP-dependent aldehyde dehydrogenase